jgi:hypothetical protein
VESQPKATASLNGSFDLGEGRYHVDWLVRSVAGNYCSADWDVSAALPPKEKEIALTIAPGVVDESLDPFREESPIQREKRPDLLTARILINCAPRHEHAVILDPQDITRMLSIVRHIVREPRIGRFSIVAFNIQQLQILWRQDSADTIDFAGLGHALESLRMGTVDVKTLSQKDAKAQFLTSLVSQESDKAGSDVVLFVGPEAESDFKISKDTFRQLRELNSPVFYVNYNRGMRGGSLHDPLDPFLLSQDPIRSLVSYLHGRRFTITTPRDLFAGWSQIMSLVGKPKTLAEALTPPIP